MIRKNILLAALSLALALSLAGCGGGITAAGNGAGVMGVSKGVITEVGDASVTGVKATAGGTVRVSGIEFKTTGARIVMNHDIRGENELKRGMVVKVKGPINDERKSGVATEIEFEDDLNGPIASIDQAGKVFVVLGQTVTVDDATVFDGTTGLSTLKVNDVVEVSGLPAADGTLLATRIEKKGVFVPGRMVELTGVVSTVNGQVFTIGGLTVTCNLPLPTGFAVGVLVEVNGILANAAGPLSATEVEVKADELDAEEGHLVHLEGIVTNFLAPATFTVNGMTVNAQGVDVTGVANNVKVRVEGTVVNGTLIAKSVTVVKVITPAPAPSPVPVPAPLNGAALYNANCASCHQALSVLSNMGATAARIQAAIANNVGDMGALSSLTSSQIQSIADVLALAPAPVPAPAPIDGAALYAANCAGCHGILANSSQKRITAAAIQVRMANPPYATRSLSAAEVQAVAAALAVIPLSARAPLPGKAVYDGFCAGCHSLGSYDVAGSPNLSGKGALVNGKFPTAGVAGHNGVTLSSAQRTDVAAFLNAN